jgi:branched-chain amino acid transport system permease protein
LTSGWIIYAVGVLTLVGFYAIIAMILNLEAGWGGMWDLGLAGLLGVGGYFFVLATVNQEDLGLKFMPGWPMLIGILGAGVVTALVAFLIGIPTLRLRGEYFLITTFAFAEMIRQLIINETEYTNGTVGITRIERPLDDTFSFNYEFVLLGITTLVVLAVYLLMRRLGRAPYGRLMRGFRDNETLALGLGKNVTRRRVQIFVLAGFLMGIIAPLYVWYIRAIVPDMYGPDITFTAWTALVVGGIGSVGGPVLGSLLLVGFTQGLLFVPVSAEYTNVLSAMPPLLLGLALILILRWRPDGLVPERWAFTPANRGVTGRFIRGRAAAVGNLIGRRTSEPS